MEIMETLEIRRWKMSGCMDVKKPGTFINVCSKSFVSRRIETATNDYANVQILFKKKKKIKKKEHSQE